jgi:hypothetical protein
MNMTTQYDIATSPSEGLNQIIGSRVLKPGDYATPIEGLGFFRREHPSAPVVCMHHHLRQLTTMSPLQYQKWMRLNEARRLMLNEHHDVSEKTLTAPWSKMSTGTMLSCAVAQSTPLPTLLVFYWMPASGRLLPVVTG